LFKGALLLNQKRHKTHFSTFWSLGLTVYAVVRFSVAYSKNVQHARTTGTEMVFPFVDSSVNNVLFQTNPDFGSHFLNSSTFLKVIWLTHCCMTVKPVIDWLLGTTGSKI